MQNNNGRGESRYLRHRSCFIYGEAITVNDCEQGLEIINYAHRYELEDLQSFVAVLLCYDSRMGD